MKKAKSAKHRKSASANAAKTKQCPCPGQLIWLANAIRNIPTEVQTIRSKVQPSKSLKHFHHFECNCDRHRIGGAGATHAVVRVLIQT